MSTDWFALYTRHRHEKIVTNILRMKGFEVFLPLYSAVHCWKDRRKELLLPLFPSYLFLRGGLDRRLDILKTPGICSFVGAKGPAAIPSAEIEALQRVTADPLRIEPYPFLRSGDRVRIKSGPFEGIEGILVRKKNLFRLVLSVELVGKSAAVEVDGWTVERVPSTENSRLFPGRHASPAASLGSSFDSIGRSL